MPLAGPRLFTSATVRRLLSSMSTQHGQNLVAPVGTCSGGTAKKVPNSSSLVISSSRNSPLRSADKDVANLFHTCDGHVTAISIHALPLRNLQFKIQIPASNALLRRSHRCVELVNPWPCSRRLWFGLQPSHSCRYRWRLPSERRRCCPFSNALEVNAHVHRRALCRGRA